jgi:hypothetical protein
MWVCRDSSYASCMWTTSSHDENRFEGGGSSHFEQDSGTVDQKWPQYKGLSPTPLEKKRGIYSVYVLYLLLVLIVKVLASFQPTLLPS